MRTDVTQKLTAFLRQVALSSSIDPRLKSLGTTNERSHNRVGCLFQKRALLTFCPFSETPRWSQHDPPPLSCSARSGHLSSADGILAVESNSVPVARLHKVSAGASAPSSQQPAVLWGTGSFRAGARTRLWFGAGNTVHKQSEKR